MKKAIISIIYGFLVLFTVFGDARLGISGTVEWDTREINAKVSLDLQSAGIRLPAGRTQGENLVNNGYVKLIQPGILSLQVDSSSTIADLISRGEMNLMDAEKLALEAWTVPPALSPDMRSISASYTLHLGIIGSSLMRHKIPTPIMRTLNPVSTQNFTGIIIIANQNLPAYGMRSSFMPVPCLFPKIWDTDMNLIFERNMLEPTDSLPIRYASESSIFRNTPSGLSPELLSLVGERPLRIFARGVFGIQPTDLIISSDDALLIISSAENRQLLSEGRIAIILDDSKLRSSFSLE